MVRAGREDHQSLRTGALSEDPTFVQWECNERQIVFVTQDDFEWVMYVADAFDAIPIAHPQTLGGYVFFLLPIPMERAE